MNSQVSAIIPVYNQAAFFPDAIESVLTENVSEIIVVDDGSEDGVGRYRSQYPCRWIRQPNKGAAAARNRGIEKAEGEFIAFIDADDQWFRGRLQLLLNEIEGADVVVGYVEEPTGVCLLPSFGAALFRKSAFDQVGLIDESLRYSEDQDWFLRARESGIRIKTVAAVTLIRRVHEASSTHNLSWNELEIHRVIKMSLDRRRKASDGKADVLREWK